MLVECDPQSAGIAKEPHGKQDSERSEHHEPLRVGQYIAKEHGEVHDDHQHPGDAVVKVNRPEQVAGVAVEPPATCGASVVHGEPSAEDRRLATGRALQPQRSALESTDGLWTLLRPMRFTAIGQRN